MYYSLLEKFGYTETQGYGKTDFAQNARTEEGKPLYEDGIHRGRDYVSKTNDKTAVALIAGTVVRSGFNPTLGRAYGQTVEMKIEEGIHLFYCHLKHIDASISPGVKLQAKEEFGKIGGTVYREGKGVFRKYDPHVHLAARTDSGFVDPKKVIEGYYMDKRETNDLAANASINWEDAKFRGQDFVTRFYENMYFLMTKFPRQFVEDKYGPQRDEFKFRSFIEWWAAYRTYDEFKEAIRADFSSYKNE